MTLHCHLHLWQWQPDLLLFSPLAWYSRSSSAWYQTTLACQIMQFQHLFLHLFTHHGKTINFFLCSIPDRRWPLIQNIWSNYLPCTNIRRGTLSAHKIQTIFLPFIISKGLIFFFLVDALCTLERKYINTCRK